ncbi:MULTISPECIES: CAP domain-containing protein [Aquimarina]|uniref:CAP domain-containing protein n=1 Tax=Aquimarina algiphila TaxID=2047982 RepID=A0A554VIF2_9FLAO|nr:MULTISPECIES: CAP domain-containing protein [Aquimarina]TSE07449.1 CAP domain-containing protein [Aquimarina algiphila]
MKISSIKYLFVFIILSIAISCSDDDGTPPDENTGVENPTGVDGTPSNTSITEEILRLVNEYRATKGLSALTSNQTADELAADHTRYMISQGQINHDNFDARGDVLNEKENARGMAENVANFYPDAKSVVDAWISSDGHRKNIEGNYTHTGIAAIKDESGKYYYTQLFYR